MFMKFLGEIGRGTRKNRLYFGTDPNPGPWIEDKHIHAVTCLSIILVIISNRRNCF